MLQNEFFILLLIGLPMVLYLYNTLNHQKQPFTPLKPGEAKLYSCGPTVYSTPSIGNYRAFFTADLIRNTLSSLCKYNTTSVMNITDVGHLTSDSDTGEDKLEKGAKRDGISAREVAKRYEEQFLDGLAQMNINPFTVMPRATDHIEEQKAMIRTLITKGYTYIIEDDGIYMDTSKISDYGELMGPNYKKRLKNLNAGERVEMNSKKNTTDFALWKFSPKEGKRQMEWKFDSFGTGFPGRHIECSAMSSKYLGNQFDIHHGGADHITIHHPNEIAQSETCYDIHRPLRRVNYRLHNEFLQVNGGKMSKSLGNVYTLDDLKEHGFSPLDLRFFFFMAHYRSQQNFTREILLQAKKTRENLQKKIFQLSSNIDTSLASSSIKDTQLFQQLSSALLDDLNTPKLLSVVNLSLTKPDTNTRAVLKRRDENVFKCDLFTAQISTTDCGVAPPVEQEVISLANSRLIAKKNKDYALADSFRTQIQDAGYSITDTPDGYHLTKN